jgi:DNA-binding winged helix-turn-helix (wHTH) protein/cytochrome c-type biogenesis protein CcmH/NrfG
LNLRFADFEIDLARQEMRRTGAIVHVEPQVFDLLVHLIRNRNRIVSKDELFEAIWQGRIVSEATLSSRISAARRALGDSGNDQSFIRTLHKRGFRFLGDVECDGSAPAANAIETGVALEGPVHEAAKLVPAHASLPLSDEPSASAPSFDDVGRGSDQEYLAHGLAVASRPALADRVSDAADDFAMLPADAGAAAAAPTKAAASNGRRITRNLLVAVGAVALVLLTAPAAWWLLWSSSTPYVKDRDALASEVVSSEDRLNAWTPSIIVLPFANLSGDPKRDYLADGITDSLISDLAHALPGVPIVSRDTAFTYKGRGADAREIGRELEVRYLLEGSVVLNLPSSQATMIEARGLFEQAVNVEPASVDGLAGVATTLVFEFLNGYYETGGDERLGRAERLLNRALAIEPRHLMALKANAALRRAQGRFDDAIDMAKMVIMENPGEPWTYKELGLSTLYLGKPEQALEWFAKADRIGPRDPGRWTWLDGRGHALVLLGRDEEAIRALVNALDANPKNNSPHAFLAAAYALLGRSEEARAALAAYLERRPGSRVSTFRTQSPVPLALTSAAYRQLFARVHEGLRKSGMPE